MTVRQVSGLLLAVVLAGACAPAGVLSVDSMAPNLQYRGFSLPRPTDARWQLDTAEQSPRVAQFFFEPMSDTHTFNASVENMAVAASVNEPGGLRRLVEARFEVDPDRFDVVDRNFEDEIVQGQPAVAFSVTVLDNQPQAPVSPLTLTLVGVVVLHPTWPDTLVWSEYSERGTEAEVNGTLDRVGQAFLDSIVLESAPGKRL